jgi:hypothetical protein
LESFGLVGFYTWPAPCATSRRGPRIGLTVLLCVFRAVKQGEDGAQLGLDGAAGGIKAVSLQVSGQSFLIIARLESQIAPQHGGLVGLRRRGNTRFGLRRRRSLGSTRARGCRGCLSGWTRHRSLRRGLGRSRSSCGRGGNRALRGRGAAGRRGTSGRRRLHGGGCLHVGPLGRGLFRARCCRFGSGRRGCRFR